MRAIKFFILGMLAASGALVFELIFSALSFILFGIEIEIDYANKLTVFLPIAVAIEEIFKFALLLKLFQSGEKNLHKLVLGIVFGGGFAFLEIFSKLSNISFYEIFSSEIIGLCILHLLTAGFISYFLIKKSLSLYALALALVSSFIIHIAYNALIIYEQSTNLIYLYFSFISILLLILTSNLQNKNNSSIIEKRL